MRLLLLLLLLVLLPNLSPLLNRRRIPPCASASQGQQVLENMKGLSAIRFLYPWDKSLQGG